MLNRTVISGFTLIELVVASALLTTISIFGVAAYRSYAESQKLQNSALDVSLMLQKAKSRAQTQVKPSNITICQNTGLSGYQVRFCNLPSSSCSGSGDYELHIVCSGLNRLVESKDLPQSVTFANTTSPVFFFRVLHGSVNTGTIRINANGQHKIIQVSGLGDITIN